MLWMFKPMAWLLDLWKQPQMQLEKEVANGKYNWTWYGKGEANGK